MTQSIEPSFFNMTQRIEPFFEHDSQKLFWVIITQRIVLSKNMTHKTQRIEPSFHKWLEDLTSFSNMSDRNNLFEKKMTRRIDFLKISIKLYKLYFDDSKNWALFFFWKDMTHRNWTFFHMTQRIEPFFEYDSKNWKIFMIFWLKELNFFWIWLENLNFSWMWLTELNFFIDSKKWVLFFQNDNDFVEYDSKNRTFVWIYPIELNLFWNFTQWIEHFAQKDSKNWTLKDYLNNNTFLWLGELGFFLFYLTQRIDFFSKISLKNYWPSFDITHRIELLFRTWLTELIFFFKNMTHWDWTLLFFLSQRKWLHFLAWLKEYFFLHIWL